MGAVLDPPLCSCSCTNNNNQRPQANINASYNRLHAQDLSSNAIITSLAPPANDDLVVFSIDNNNIIPSKLCVGPVSSCKFVSRLIKILSKYNELFIDSKTTNDASDLFITKCMKHMVLILNDFNHLLLKHNTNNKDHNYIFKSFKYCDMYQCCAIKRHYRNKHEYREQYFDLLSLYLTSDNHDNINSDSLIYVYQILDKIHSHLQHLFDIGYRITEKEIKYLKETNSTHTDDTKLMRLKRLMEEKRSRFDILCGKQRGYNDTDNDDIKEEKTISLAYSYSYPFFYWSYYRNIDSQFIHGYAFKDLYITHKYHGLKEELIDNDIYNISYEDWTISMDKTIQLALTVYCRKYIKPFVNRYMPGLRNEPEHISNYGLTDNSPISLNHIISVMLYCSYSNLKNRFSETFHNDNSDENNPFQVVKQKHSSYANFARHLREAVIIFGTIAATGKVSKFYHCIPNKVLFDSTQSNIYGIMSTTSTFHIALNNANSDGMIVELVPVPNLKYFQCNLISSYSNENEMLFIGGTHPIDFTNLFIMKYLDINFIQHIKALRIIDTMTNGYYMDNDCTIYIRLIKSNTNNIQKLGGKKLSDSEQNLCQTLIYHELSRYDNQYDKYDVLHPYINDLLHHICTNKNKIILDLDTLNIEIKKEYSSGYIGYKFLKNIFCINDDYEGNINYKLIYTLFPNLKRIYVTNYKDISGDILDNIIQFLSTTASDNKYLNRIQLSLSDNASALSYKLLIDEAKKRDSQFKPLNYMPAIGKNRIGLKTLSINKSMTI